MALVHSYPAEASTAIKMVEGPSRVESFRIANTQATAVNVKMYLSPTREVDELHDGHAMFPSTSVLSTLEHDTPFDVPAGWTLYAWCDTAFGASFWVTTNV